jgi:hypothetical protein
MHALSTVSLLSDPATSGADANAATVLGLALIAAYIGALVWLHVHRRRRRQARRAAGNPVPSLPPAAAQARPELPGPAPAGALADRAVAPAPTAPPERPRRLAETTLQPLADRLECSRRVAVAETRVGDALERLPRERWLVERYVAVVGQRVPFVVLGETGVFALWALDQTPLWDDLPLVNRAAAALQALLPGYAGEVHVGLCRAFDPVVPRWWYAIESGSGAWLLGVNWLEHWLEHFGDAGGLADGDVAWTASQAEPRWRARRPGSLPTTPNLG